MSAPRREVKLTREQAVAWVMETTRSRRPFAVRTVQEAKDGQTPYGMTYRDGYWRVVAAQDEDD